MRDALANLVHPVLRQGLQLKARLEHGELPSLEREQALLRGLLLPEAEAGRCPDFGREAGVGDDDGQGPTGAASGTNPFLGVRYALTCWLDELFILYTPWSAEWNERKLEVALYGTNDRAWRFWEQARLAEGRPTTDALEAFFLCVALGFRGQMLETPEPLRAWCKATQARLARLGEGWPHPPELEPPTAVPPLRGRDRFRAALFWTLALVLLWVPVAAFLIVQRVTD